MIPQQNTPEWLEFRKTRIGASDAPAIMGVSPWKTAHRLWLEKTGRIEPVKQTEAMKRGLDLEDHVRLYLCLHMGFTVTPIVRVSDTYDWMMASFDGYDDVANVYVEIKCPNKDDHFLATSGRVPDKYYPQVQHQIYVGGVKKLLYVSYDGTTFAHVWIERDDEYIEKLLKEEEKFRDCLFSDIPPPMTDRDFFFRDDDLWKEAASQWKECKKKLEEYELKEKMLRSYIISMCDGVHTEGCGLRVTKIAKKGTIEYEKIPELNRVDLELYRKPNTDYWRLTDVG